MDRIAGMVITDGTAAGVVLEKDGDGWRVHNTANAPIALLSWPGCPVILDAAAWDLGVETGETLSESLLAVGWDVRPPRWEGGRAVNPSYDELARALLVDLGMCDMVPSFAGALRLAAWGATHPTSATPPRCADPDGPCIGPPCMVESPHQFAECRINMPALRSEDDPRPGELVTFERMRRAGYEEVAPGKWKRPPRQPDDALAYVDDLAGLARRGAGHVMHPTGACTCGGERACAWCMFDEVRRQRDEAERLLLALCGSTGPSAGDIQAARLYLAKRGLLPTEGA